MQKDLRRSIKDCQWVGSLISSEICWGFLEEIWNISLLISFSKSCISLIGFLTKISSTFLDRFNLRLISLP